MKNNAKLENVVAVKRERERANLYLICNLFTKPQHSLNNSYLRTVEEKSSNLDFINYTKKLSKVTKEQEKENKGSKENKENKVNRKRIGYIKNSLSFLCVKKT